MLDLAQVAAWARMFSGYARTESIAAAVCETFDPGKPCEICQAVSRARKAGEQHAPAVAPSAAAKIVLILERTTPFVCERTERAWAEPGARFAPSRPQDVLIRPPRLA